jgi:uncharacterized delta-60 repeat protein
METKHSAEDRLKGMLICILSSVVILAIGLAITGSAVHASPLSAAGDLDGTFSGDGRVYTAFVAGQFARLEGVAIQPNGFIIAAGHAWQLSGQSDLALARYNTSGGLDPAFGGTGKAYINLGAYDHAYKVLIHQPTGKIIVAGEKCAGQWAQCRAAVVRLNSGGALDTTFNGTGKRIDGFGGIDNGWNAAAVYPDGRILAVGYMYNGTNYDFALMRFTVSGGPDAGFSGDGKAKVAFGPTSSEYAQAIALQPDGKIVIAGYTCTATWSDCNFGVARLNDNGSLDTSFSGDGKQVVNFGGTDYAYDLALQLDGKIVVVGENWIGSTGYFAIARLTPNGGMDVTFGGVGKVVTNFSGDSLAEAAQSVLTQLDGKIVVCGYISNGSFDDFAIARYNSNGTPDRSFSGDGKATVNFGDDDNCMAIARQADGKYVLAGHNWKGPEGRFALARIWH